MISSRQAGICSPERGRLGGWGYTRPKGLCKYPQSISSISTFHYIRQKCCRQSGNNEIIQKANIKILKYTYSSRPIDTLEGVTDRSFIIQSLKYSLAVKLYNRVSHYKVQMQRKLVMGVLVENHISLSALHAPMKRRDKNG